MDLRVKFVILVLNKNYSRNKRMHISKLHILNYRNIEDKELHFSPSFNCILGMNGVGKTNILDSIYHLSMCKSSINSSDIKNIMHGKDFFMLKAEYQKSEDEISIYCGLKKGGKKIIKRDDKSYSKMSEHIGLIPIVMISPDDISLVDGLSEERRKMMDSIICQKDKEYLSSLIKYNKLLLQRNSLLRDNNNSGIFDMLDVFDEQMSFLSDGIRSKRQSFLENYRTIFQEQYLKIAPDRENISISYKPSIPIDKTILDAFKEARSKDIILGYTSVGVHRDDISFEIDGYPLKKTASQGQKKTFFIALKLSQYIWYRQDNDVKPILLLDDIFAKLDNSRSENIIKIVRGEDFGQIFITDTKSDYLPEILDDLNYSDKTILKL